MGLSDPNPQDAYLEYWQALESGRSDGSPFARYLRNMVAHNGGMWATPPPVLQFIRSLLKARSARTLLDPSAQLGFLPSSLTKAVPLNRSVAITRQAEARALIERVGPPPGFQLIVGEPLHELDRITDQFDAVVSELPLNPRRESAEILVGDTRMRVTATPPELLVLASLSKLGQVGFGLFVVSPRFLDMRPEVRECLSLAGGHVTAFLEVPSGIYSPWTSMPFACVLIERQSSEKLFVGALSEDAERNEVLIGNLTARRAGPEPALGAITDPATFRSFRALQLEERVSRQAKPLGLQAIRLGEISAAINLVKGPGTFEGLPNCLYLPLIGRGPARAAISDLTMKQHNYAQVVLDPAKADARYLAGSFGSELGLLLREQAWSGTTIPKLTKGAIPDLPVYLPPLNEQLRILEVESRVTGLLGDAQALREQLWSRPRQVQKIEARLARLVRNENAMDWIDDLPFPLATIAWTWHAAGNDWRLRCETLLHFFEAYAEFAATILLSAFSNDEELFKPEREAIQEQLRVARASVVRSSFGTWVRIVELLAKRARGLLNGSEEERRRCFELFRMENRAFLEGLLSSSIVGILQETNGRRNTWLGHAGAVSEEELRNRHVALSGDLAELRAKLGGAWVGAAIVQPGDRSRFADGVHLSEVSKLMGTRTPFAKQVVELTEPLEHGRMYLLGENEAKGLRLLPLVRITSSPESAQNACYFYSSQQDGNLRFVSYHFGGTPNLVEPFPDTAAALRAVFPEEFK